YNPSIIPYGSLSPSPSYDHMLLRCLLKGRIPQFNTIQSEVIHISPWPEIVYWCPILVHQTMTG
ncbi:hypothetical protein BDB01DRAFT_790009, partial [Pilobolus umbonatus]